MPSSWLAVLWDMRSFKFSRSWASRRLCWSILPIGLNSLPKIWTSLHWFTLITAADIESLFSSFCPESLAVYSIWQSWNCPGFVGKDALWGEIFLFGTACFVDLCSCLGYRWFELSLDDARLGYGSLLTELSLLADFSFATCVFCCFYAASIRFRWMKLGAFFCCYSLTISFGFSWAGDFVSKSLWFNGSLWAY